MADRVWPEIKPVATGGEIEGVKDGKRDLFRLGLLRPPKLVPSRILKRTHYPICSLSAGSVSSISTSLNPPPPSLRLTRRFVSRIVCRTASDRRAS
jgi:hypothetical protein